MGRLAIWRRKSKEEEPPALEAAPPFPEFPYHPDPLRTGSVMESALPCALCGHRYGFVYTGPVFASDDFVEGPLWLAFPVSGVVVLLYELAAP